MTQPPHIRNVDRGEWEPVPDWITFLFLGSAFGLFLFLCWVCYYVIKHRGGF